MPTRVQRMTKFSPTTVEEARNAILMCLASDGTDDSLHDDAMEGLRFLEQDRSNISRETHKMRMALMFCRKNDRASEHG